MAYTMIAIICTDFIDTAALNFSILCKSALMQMPRLHMPGRHRTATHALQNAASALRMHTL
jgi:hypothetical protein